jgi:hypothetical protein
VAQRGSKPASPQARLFEGGLTINGLEGWLWDAACSIQRPVPQSSRCHLPDQRYPGCVSL